MWLTLFFLNVLFLGSLKSMRYNSNDQSSCIRLFQVSNNTIIKATESLKNGARYLKATRAISREQCMAFCCDLVGCNMAVLQEQVDGDCYLFDCGTFNYFKCTFSDHVKHVAMGMLGDRKDSFNYDSRRMQQSKHEQDLNALKNGRFPFSQNVQRSLENNSMLIDRRGGNFRRSRLFGGCTSNQFQCGSGGECIAIYDRCDGISQCSDGSDERNCDSHGPDGQEAGLVPSDEKNMQNTQTDNQQQVQFRGNDADRRFLSKMKSQLPNIQPDATEIFTKQGYNTQTSDEDNNGKLRAPHRAAGNPALNPNVWPSAENVHRNVLPPSWLNGSRNVIADDLRKSTVDYDIQSNPSVERLDTGSSDTSLAAIVLGLGLAILALLLIFTFHRLRKARRGLRRSGKVMDVNEGEFLINGIYL